MAERLGTGLPITDAAGREVLDNDSADKNVSSHIDKYVSPHKAESRELPESTFSCRICGEINLSVPLPVPEMMFGMGQTFPYQECGQCGCLQICNYPSRMEPFYPDDYYAFRQLQPELYRYRSRSDWFRRKITLWNYLVAGDLLGKAGVETTIPYPTRFKAIRETGVKPWSSILDVGAGNGRFLCELYRMGFTDLAGVDRYIPDSFSPVDGVRIFRKELGEVPGSFDLITMNHVLEHMPDQFDVLCQVRERLNRGGVAMVRIPVKSKAWELYREHWVQLDAPRHFYLHTESSLRRLAGRAGLKVTRVIYDSTAFQFWGSEQYRNGVTLRRDERSLAVKRSQPDSETDREPGIFTLTQLQQWEEMAEEWNRQGYGDQAAFYLERA